MAENVAKHRTPRIVALGSRFDRDPRQVVALFEHCCCLIERQALPEDVAFPAWPQMNDGLVLTGEIVTEKLTQTAERRLNGCRCQVARAHGNHERRSVVGEFLSIAIKDHTARRINRPRQQEVVFR
ncbi:hypothetical protein AMJ85_06465 [candidate division BRC1 bacterium SM23_51]|nr:MAG: hypothetical protein AMJ85_06465 [candidate division BRC1 bacterium SM23_51]